jgi:tetratricopeptide (TPR) repeat protein
MILRVLISAALLAWVMAVSVMAEDIPAPSAKVTSTAQGGYGRVQFDWTEKVSGRAAVAGGVLVISFDKSFDVDTDAIANQLEPFVALVRQDPDGRSLRFALKGPVRLKSTDLGTRFAFDLLPPSFAGEPAPPASPDPYAGKTPPPLAVRVTERERTTRLQFDWPGPVDYKAKLESGKLRVSFSKNSKVDLKRFTDSPPAWVRGARSSVVDGKLQLEFDVDAEADFYDVSQGDRIALELREPKTDEAAGAHPKNPAGAPISLLPAKTDEPVPPPPTIVAETIAFALPPRKGVQPAKPEQSPAAAPATAAVDTHAPAAPANSDAAAVHAAGAPVVETDAVTGTPSADANPLPPSLRLAQSDLEVALAPLPAATPAEPGKARAEIFGSILRVELPYTKLPAAAVFRRGLAIWVVTATSELMDMSVLAQLNNAPTRLLSTPSEIAPGITAFRLESPASMSVSAAAAGNSWVLAIGNTVPNVPTQVQLVRQTVGTTTKLRAYLPGVQQVVWLKDPQTEDRIAAVLSFAPARGLASGRQFVEFAALPSQQGLAVQSSVDDLTVSVDGQDAVIARPKSLNISSAQFAQSLPSWGAPVQSGVSTSFADLAAWGKPIAETRAEAVRKLMRLSSTSPGGMSAPRMALARYYIAEGFGAEALGVLANIAREDRTADATPQFRIARAIAHIQMARHREALTDLSMEAFGNDPHAALWRGLAAVGVRDWRQARSNLMSSLKTLNRYPLVWQARARVALAQSALALNEPSSAMQALAGIPRGDLPADVTAEALLVRAALDVVSGKTEFAIKTYDQVAASPYRPAAVRAKLEGTLLKVKGAQIKAEDAIEALERLRFQWRGDAVELKTLTELGKLYVENHRVRDGLNTMRLAVRHFSNTDEARATATQMAQIFEGLFLAGQADDLPPVQALALFYDFRELTPAGAQGDDMIRKLSDRLIAVDLLPQAAELLQHQVDQRLEGIAKASVATRLALIYLLDRKAEKALNLVRSTKQTRLPDELIAQRNLIEARSLTDLKMFDQALEIVSIDAGPEADRLRADIMWEAQRWPDAGAKAESLLGTRYEDIAPLTDVERSDLMRAAVAYSLAGDSASLERLRTRFEAKMSQSMDAKAFTMVTASPDVTADDYKNLVKRVAGVDTLDAFLQDFRTRYGQGGQTLSN